MEREEIIRVDNSPFSFGYTHAKLYLTPWVVVHFPPQQIVNSISLPGCQKCPLSEYQLKLKHLSLNFWVE